MARKISPLRLGAFAAAPAEPCKYTKTAVEMTSLFDKFTPMENTSTPKALDQLLLNYDVRIQHLALLLREVVITHLPNITEQVDFPAKMIAYCYGQKYAELICTIIPSKKGLKLGFNRGTSLPDPDHLLAGTGKISRYVEIRSEEQIASPAIQKLLADALELYHQQLKK